MPYKAKKKMTFRRRPARAGRGKVLPRRGGSRFGKRGFVSNRPTSAIGRLPGGFPDKMLTKLTYEYSANQTTASAIFDYRWNLNSVFDPDLTGGGHQPRGFDQFTPLYNRYRVHKVTGYVITRQRANHGITSNLIATNDGSLITDVFAAEQAHSTPQKMTSANVYPARQYFCWYPNVITGVSKSVYNADDRYQSTVGTSPNEVIVLHHIVESVDSTTALDYEFTIKLTYWTEFFDRIYLPPS